jgi:hypothetical protein
LVIIPHGQLDWITDIPQSARLGASELHAARDLSVVNVKAGYDPFGEHWISLG